MNDSIPLNKRNEVPVGIVLLIGFIIFIGNFLPSGYAGRMAGTLLDTFGVLLMIYAFFGLISKKDDKTNNKEVRERSK